MNVPTTAARKVTSLFMLPNACFSSALAGSAVLPCLYGQRGTAYKL